MDNNMIQNEEKEEVAVTINENSSKEKMKSTKKDNNSGMKVLIIILIVALVGLSTYLVWNKFINNENNNKQDETVVDKKDEESAEEEKNQDNSTENEGVKSRNLTDIELSYFETYFNKSGIYHLAMGNYTDVRDVDLNWVLYCGLESSLHQFTSQIEEDDYLKAIDASEMMTDIDITSKSKLEQFLMDTTGYKLDDFKIKLRYTYIEKYDSYYHQHGDTNYTGTIKCDSGQIDASGNYILSCYLDYSQGQANKITLSKNSNNTYKFLSSVCVKNCDKDY